MKRGTGEEPDGSLLEEAISQLLLTEQWLEEQVRAELAAHRGAVSTSSPEDLLQATYLVMIQQVTTCVKKDGHPPAWLVPESRLHAYLKGVVRHLVSRQHRDPRTARRPLATGTAEEVESEQLPRRSTGNESSHRDPVSRNEQDGRLRRLLARLTPRDRRILLLYEEGLDEVDTAGHVDRCASGVVRHGSRSLARLRAMLSGLECGMP